MRTPKVVASRMRLFRLILTNRRCPCPPVPTTNSRIPRDVRTPRGVIREPLVVVVVPVDHDFRVGGVQIAPELAHGRGPAVGARAEERVVPIGEDALVRVAAEVPPEPAFCMVKTKGRHPRAAAVVVEDADTRYRRGCRRTSPCRRRRHDAKK